MPPKNGNHLGYYKWPKCPQRMETTWAIINDIKAKQIINLEIHLILVFFPKLIFLIDNKYFKYLK